METLKGAKRLNTVFDDQRKSIFFDRGSDLHPLVSLLTPLGNLLLQGRAVRARLQMLIKDERNCSLHGFSSKKQDIR